MIGRVLLAAILAGIVAGIAMGVVQHWRITPMILQAETFEHVAHGHAAEAHDHAGEAWSPAPGAERLLYTGMTSILAAVGFSLVLSAASVLSQIPLNLRNGLVWGVCGFIAFSLAPAFSLPPELPGMAAIDVSVRQFWWLVAATLTAAGLWLLHRAVDRKDVKWLAAAVAAVCLPHVFAPTAPELANAAGPPAEPASRFAAASLGANLLMWAFIGGLLGYAFDKFKVSFDDA